jgi:myosin-5
MGRRAAARAQHEALCAAAALAIQCNWRRVLAQRQAASLAEDAGHRRALAAARDALASSLQEASERADRAEAALAASQAHAATLQSQVAELQAELESATASAAAAVAAGAAGTTAAQQAAAARAADLEQAHKRAAQALKAELEVARQQKAAAEERAAEVDARALEAQALAAGTAAELQLARRVVADREAEVAALQERVQRGGSDALAAAAAGAAALAAAQLSASKAMEAAQERAAAERDQAVQAVEAASEQAEEREQAARAAAAASAVALAESQQRTSHLASRVEALSSRAAKLESDARAAASREHSLLVELEAAKRAALVRTPSDMSARAPISPLRRTITHDLEAAASPHQLEAPSPAELAPPRAAAVDALVEAAVGRALAPVEVWAGPAGSLRVPQAAWLLHRCLMHWAREWRPSEVAAAAARAEGAMVRSAAAGGLAAAAYWLGASLATGALLKMRSVGRPDLDQLFRLGDSFIGLTELHAALGAAVAESLPVDVALLLSDDAKRSARRRSSAPHRAALALAPNLSPVAAGAGAAPCDPPSSPADAELVHMGRAEAHWRALLGGVADVVERLRAGGVPAPAVRAVAWATLRYVDGELLNALLLRRDCCSVSAAKALQTGLAALQGWAAYAGPEWCCTPDEAARATERVSQAARYLVQGKDDCVRKALKGVDLLPDLGRLCPALTLQQVHRLTEHQHDDWLAGAGSGAGGQNMVLLETLRRLMADQRQRPPGAAAAARAPAAPAAAPSPTPGGPASGWVTFGTADAAGSDVEEDEEDLLVDSQLAFELFRSQHQLTRRLLTEAARSFVQAPGAARAAAGGATPAAGGSSPAATATPSPSHHTPTRLAGTPTGPRLPNGNLPQLSPSFSGGSPGAAAGITPASVPPSGLSLLDTIDHSCAQAALPAELSANPSFAFLTAAS